MSYINELSSFTNIGKKGGRDFLLNYYSENGNPQNRLKVIHITGTAGKGSTSVMIANGLKLAGYKVGLFTSPHLFKLNERIKINNEDISDENLNNYIKYFFEKFPGISFAEYLTLIAVKYFIDKNVDYVVCEAFIGGEHDSTNIFNPLATVITSIGLDHQNLLGNTEEEILKDKLGIMRKAIPLFTRLNNKIIEEEIKKIRAKYIKVDKIEETNLKGNFQKENAGIASEVLGYLGIDKETIRQALKNIEWEGRLQFVEKNILIDCAHNPLGMKKLKEYVNTLDFDNIYYLFAISKNKNFKDYEKYLDDAKEVIFTKPDMFKIEDPKNYTTCEKIIKNAKEEYNHLKNKLKNKDLLVVCGSIYLASEVLSSVNATPKLHLTRDT